MNREEQEANSMRAMRVFRIIAALNDQPPPSALKGDKAQTMYTLGVCIGGLLRDELIEVKDVGAAYDVLKRLDTATEIVLYIWPNWNQRN